MKTTDAVFVTRPTREEARRLLLFFNVTLHADGPVTEHGHLKATIPTQPLKRIAAVNGLGEDTTLKLLTHLIELAE